MAKHWQYLIIVGVFPIALLVAMIAVLQLTGADEWLRRLFGIMPWRFIRGHRISAEEFIRAIEASDG